MPSILITWKRDVQEKSLLELSRRDGEEKIILLKFLDIYFRLSSIVGY